MNNNNNPSAEAIARAFVSARAKAHMLPDFPGTIPATLDMAYEVQDHAISLWQDSLAGWKVGRINGALAVELGTDRLAGPIFKQHVSKTSDSPTVFSIFEGGFGAVEAEFILEIGCDAPENKTVWTTEDTLSMISNVYAGIEIASSPLPTINDLGPPVIISDFGNNASLIIGPAVTDWKTRDLKDWKVETFIEGKSVGTGDAEGIPGGPIESVRFLLELSAKRGMPLKAGCLVSTGAVSGVHDILIGQQSRISFGGIGEIFCVATKAEAEAYAYPEAFEG